MWVIVRIYFTLGMPALPCSVFLQSPSSRHLLIFCTKPRKDHFEVLPGLYFRIIFVDLWMCITMNLDGIFLHTFFHVGKVSCYSQAPLWAWKLKAVLLRDVNQVVIEAFLLAGGHIWTSAGSVDLSGNMIAFNRPKSWCCKVKQTRWRLS